jgi:hypothetical protein
MFVVNDRISRQPCNLFVPVFRLTVYSSTQDGQSNLGLPSDLISCVIELMQPFNLGRGRSVACTRFVVLHDCQ